MSSVEQSEWDELRGLFRLIGIWLVALVVAILLLFALRATVFAF